MNELYRYEDNKYNDSDLNNCMELYTYSIAKETPKGYWIVMDSYPNKWVSKEGKNIYAWDTKEKALYNYYKRKEMQVEILKNKLYIAELCFKEASELIENKENKQLEGSVK